MKETDFYYFKQHDVIFVFRILGNLSVVLGVTLALKGCRRRLLLKGYCS